MESINSVRIDITWSQADKRWTVWGRFMRPNGRAHPLICLKRVNTTAEMDRVALKRLVERLGQEMESWLL